MGEKKQQKRYEEWEISKGCLPTLQAPESGQPSVLSVTPTEFAERTLFWWGFNMDQSNDNYFRPAHSRTGPGEPQQWLRFC